ncbi:MAG TPA: hypothetical protein VHA71_10330 [Rhodanobacteraceae bacterium]|nr:hypothetical protein [Rhodanobacteraceae bacterium]
MIECEEVVAPCAFEFAKLDLQHPGVGMQAWIIRLCGNRGSCNRSGIKFSVAIIQQFDCMDRELDVAAISRLRKAGAKDRSSSGRPPLFFQHRCYSERGRGVTGVRIEQLAKL